MVTNVPGPQDTLYLLGRELEAVSPLVPLGANPGLGVAIVSYADGIFFGFASDPDIVPDVGELPSLLHRALEELAEAAGVELSAPAPGVGDSAAGGEPWPGYDEQTVAEIRKAVSQVDPVVLARVRAYEREHKDRKGVREAVGDRPG